MRRRGRAIFAAGGVVSIALFGLLLLQATGVAPPLGASWGNGAVGRGFLIRLNGSLLFRTVTGSRAAPPDVVYRPQWLGTGFGVPGVHYHRWNDTTETLDRKPLPGVYGTCSELGIAPGWLMLLSLAVPSIWLRSCLEARRSARDRKLCRECGYDLRATPERCPECGRAPAGPAAA